MISQPLHLPIEPTFNQFVETFGGELVEKLLPQRASEKRADYLFRQPAIVAELKCIEHELFNPEYFRKLNDLVNDWQDRNLIGVIGRTMIHLRTVPTQCQKEWCNLTEQPLNRNIVSRANRQIRDTKAALGLPNATGVLLLANDGNHVMSPVDIVTFLARILSRRKPDGGCVCSSIEWIVLFSTNIAVVSESDGRPMSFWRAGYRSEQPAEAVSHFLADMNVAWNRYCAIKRGMPLKEIDLSGMDFEQLRFV